MTKTNTITKTTNKAAEMVKCSISFEVTNLFREYETFHFSAVPMDLKRKDAEVFNTAPMWYITFALFDTQVLNRFKFFDGYDYSELENIVFENEWGCVQFDEVKRKIYIYNPDDLCECVTISNIRLTNPEK